MKTRTFAVLLCTGVLSLCSQLAVSATARAKEEPLALAKADPASDLSKFPKLRGEVKQVLGLNFQSFIPPRAGDAFQLELPAIPKLTSLAIDPARKSYVPLPGPVVVASIHYYSNGAFQSMRLVSKKERHSVTVDIVSVPGRGGPKRVEVWVVVQSEVVGGVALIDGEYEGAFPDQAKPPLPRGNVLLPEQAKEYTGAVVATLLEVGDPERGPLACRRLSRSCLAVLGNVSDPERKDMPRFSLGLDRSGCPNNHWNARCRCGPP